MDDFLTKPVDPEALAATLATWLGTEPAPAPALRRPASPAPRRPGLARLDMLRDLAPGDTTYLDRAIGNFVSSGPDDLDAIRAAVEDADPTALRQSAHRLAGGAANLGLIAVAAAARDLELLADKGTTHGAADVLPRLAEALDGGRSAVLAYRDSYGGADRPLEVSPHGRHPGTAFGVRTCGTCQRGAPRGEQHEGSHRPAHRHLARDRRCGRLPARLLRRRRGRELQGVQRPRPSRSSPDRSTTSARTPRSPATPRSRPSDLTPRPDGRVVAWPTTRPAPRARNCCDCTTHPELLTVVNVWDAASAKVVAGIPGTTALATASHSIAATYGYPDGEQIPVDLMLEMVGRIVGGHPPAGDAPTSRAGTATPSRRCAGRSGSAWSAPTSRTR